MCYDPNLVPLGSDFEDKDEEEDRKDSNSKYLFFTFIPINSNTFVSTTKQKDNLCDNSCINFKAQNNYTVRQIKFCQISFQDNRGVYTTKT